MTKYEEYKNRLQDVKYIFLSNKMDLIDYQYILTLIHESIFVISEDLIFELKNVLSNVKLEEVPENTDITNEQTYQHILWEIKRDINNYNVILDKTKIKIVNILSALENVMQEENQSQSEIKNEISSECSENCLNCHSPCSITTDFTNNVVVEENENVNEIITNTANLNIKYFNYKNLKDYLIHIHAIKNECSVCGLTEWQNTYLPLEIDFIDGNNVNQNLSNIRLLCPNCFSQIGHPNE